MAYKVYIGGMLLPIPQKITTNINGNNKTMDLIGIGEVLKLKNPKLTDIEIKGIIPQTQYPFSTYENGFQGAKYYFDKLEKIKMTLEPTQLIILRENQSGKLLFSTNTKASLEDYSLDEDAENGLDIDVTLKIKIWRDYKTKKVVLQNTNSAVIKPVRPPSPNQPKGKTYRVKKGDSLWWICKTQLNDGSKSRYEKVYQLNKELIDKYNKKYGTTKLKYTIYPGQVLRLE